SYSRSHHPRLPTLSLLFPYTTLFRSCLKALIVLVNVGLIQEQVATLDIAEFAHAFDKRPEHDFFLFWPGRMPQYAHLPDLLGVLDRKSTRLNSSHQIISYAVFCLKKK